MNKGTIAGEEFAHWYATAQQMAIANGIEPGELDWLLQGWTDLDRLGLRLQDFRHREIALQETWENIQRGWRRRVEEKYPVQYLLGQTQWRDFTIKVTDDVLIPRPETELIIDIVQREHPYFPVSDCADHWVDLGTGSGIIALGLAATFAQAIVHGVDCSGSALAIARDNAQLNQLGDRIQFHQGHWWKPLNHLRGQVQGMVSNPPYIPQWELAHLQPEVINHEPLLALDGGPDGLEAVEQLIRRSPAYLKPGGFWLVEIMVGQAPIVAQQLKVTGCYQDIQIHLDLAGIERFVSARTLA
ncbi:MULTISPECIES: peptide chain release factor N(5)-glutamine methyltransferase [unclassified Synechocystis]|uniref:peptide chain release factor N(5)-glutamine methyltransferase n=1 Tax=unclassified Synechocystis TaxID=2640012 RepID=UPI000414430E|nr:MULTISPECIES: peptide chain release factor N(5)-glutamine methyltransferase [unclassified Synechocystis]AIE75524.1 Protein-N(5)-glutamine methyltransferase PrmC, methylates polypeptide chain release factors RF1 and RF2 [Synechocystis sp. PCC 6714]MCT0253736.1 peptide chain release factor N(5)-glutamine methyltransferase [Synechocystis sp. CS-94]